MDVSGHSFISSFAFVNLCFFVVLFHWQQCVFAFQGAFQVAVAIHVWIQIHVLLATSGGKFGCVGVVSGVKVETETLKSDKKRPMS